MNTAKKIPQHARVLFTRNLALAGAFALALGAPALFAASEESYDPYTSEMAYTPLNSAARDGASNFLTYPFELVRWPLNKTLDFLDEERIPQKTRYVFEKLEDNGIIPKLGVQATGVEIDLPRLLRLEDNLPADFVSNGWIYYGPEITFKTGLKEGFEPADGAGFHAFGVLDYEKRSEEFFYGFGPDTSAGEGTSYETETTTLEARAGYTLESAWKLDNVFAFRNINIGEADDDDRGRVGNTFPAGSVPGFGGDKIITLGSEISWNGVRDTRNLDTPPLFRFGVDYNEGLDDSRARYLKFTTELAKSVTLGSPTRILAARFFGEHNNAFNGGETPFHQMPRLGGFGGYPLNSETMRGFVRGRFTDETAALFNLEYRYRIYQFRNWTVTHALFLDEGQTFKKFSTFQLKDFRESYGTGFRLGYLHRVIFDFEVAHADEGTAFYFKNRQPF